MELSQRLNFDALNLTHEEPAADTSVAGRLAELIGRFTDAEVTPDATLDELGVSSLDRIELAVRAEEEFGVRADESAYTPGTTVGELVEWLADNEPA
ncbi:acyl carrier protein [Corynebacterium timonense]|nr:acyl carrier protein [Corynebacterium timonense]